MKQNGFKMPETTAFEYEGLPVYSNISHSNKIEYVKKKIEDLKYHENNHILIEVKEEKNGRNYKRNISEGHLGK